MKVFGLKMAVIISILFLSFVAVKKNDFSAAVQIAEQHLSNMVATNKDVQKYPRSTHKDGSIALVRPSDWTSGFFPGTLWYMYEYTHDEKWLQLARKWTMGLEKQQFNRSTHDVGFILYCSYGNGYRLTQDTAYKRVLINGANSLKSRYNEKIGSIRSWDFSKEKWQFPVIIDNMMNLELLFWATKNTGDSSYYHIAKSHAVTTMQNHFRSDYSSYHLVDYDTLTGKAMKKQTFQGFNDASAWARGQAWGLHGFTTAYRETKDRRFLLQARRCANFFLSNKNLPKDKIPYWDFNDTAIPNVSRDASAAAIVASALLELSTYPGHKSKAYKKAAVAMLGSLCSTDYLAKPNTNNNFMLMHSTGNLPAGSEIDKPLNYADYYFMEALVRNKGKKKR